MEKPRSGVEGVHFASSEDIRRLFPHLDDHAVASVLALHPTAAQLEEAAARATGAGDIFAGIRPEKGAVEAIVEIASVAEDGFEEQ